MKGNHRGNFYNTYRPQILDDVIGQEPVTITLKRAVLQDKLANSYLFFGPRGSGKTSTARALCRSVNCLNRDGANACLSCEGCEHALSDAIEIDAASNRGIDEITTLIEDIRFLPKFVQKKFVIIDEAHQLTAAAANALLKVVEEPPSFVHFIFCTTRSPVITDTKTSQAFSILSSRCQIFAFKRIDSDTILTKLADICVNEGKKAEKDVLLSIIDRSDGSLRDAENILEALFTLNDRLLAKDLNQLYGSAPNHAIMLLECCVKKDLGAGLLLVPKIWESGISLLEVARLVITYTGDLLRLRAGQTIYRPSFIVSGLQDILEYVVIDIDTLSSTLAAFTDMVERGREDSISLDLALCSAILETSTKSNMEKPVVVAPDANNAW